jgi:hypothetical protein
VALARACGSVVAQDRAFDFALIGDMPYIKVQEREYQRVLVQVSPPNSAANGVWGRGRATSHGGCDHEEFGMPFS